MNVIHTFIHRLWKTKLEWLEQSGLKTVFDD